MKQILVVFLTLFLPYAGGATLIIAVKTDSCIYVGVDSRVTVSGEAPIDGYTKVVQTDSFSIAMFGDDTVRVYGAQKAIKLNPAQYMPQVIKGTILYYDGMIISKNENFMGAIFFGVCNGEYALKKIQVGRMVNGAIGFMVNDGFCFTGGITSEIDSVIANDPGIWDANIPDKIYSLIKSQKKHREIGGKIFVYKFDKNRIGKGLEVLIVKE